jgi:hypothetical protein
MRYNAAVGARLMVERRAEIPRLACSPHRGFSAKQPTRVTRVWEVRGKTQIKTDSHVAAIQNTNVRKEYIYISTCYPT